MIYDIPFKPNGSGPFVLLATQLFLRKWSFALMFVPFVLFFERFQMLTNMLYSYTLQFFSVLAFWLGDLESGVNLH